MGYPEDETGSASSKPAELYTFVTPVATYRYTSHDLAVTYGGNTYNSIAISRPAITAAAANPAEFAIRLPYDDAFALAEAYAIPSYGIDFTLTRVQLNSGIGLVIGTGKVAGFATEDVWTSVRIPSLFADALDAPIPGVYFQPACAHRLYDARCTIDRNSWKVVTTLSTYDGKRTYTVATISGHVDQWARAGEIVVTTTGERRLIVDQVGTTIELNAPIKAFAAGLGVTVYAGCDHTIDGAQGCVPKFSNRDHFVGFPYIEPNRNPFDGGQKAATVNGIYQP